MGLGGPYQSPTLVLIHHAQKWNALLQLSVSLQKQQIQILYYLTQLQMTSNNMYTVQILAMLKMVRSLTHSDSDSYAPEVMVRPDARVLRSIIKE